MKVYSQLEKAQAENLGADAAAGTIGRFWWNTASLRLMTDDGTNVRALLRNDQKAIFGNNVTANNNIRFHRGASGVLQFVTGGDATAEGTLSTTLNQISFRAENYTNAGQPAAANAGRFTWITDTGIPRIDTGAAWKDVVLSDASQNLSNKLLLDTTTFFANTADTTKKFVFSLVGNTTGKKGTLVCAVTNDRVFTLPDRAITFNLGTDIDSGVAASGSVLTADGLGASAWVSNSTVGVPTGTVLPFAGTVAPAGFLFCDGSSVLRATFATLYAAIGSNYGTADGTHFNLPDMRGLFMRGTDDMGTAAGAAGNDPDAGTARTVAYKPGGATGNTVGSYQLDAIHTHTHDITQSAGQYAGPGHFTDFASDGGGAFGFVGNMSSNAAGGNETRPKNTYFNFIIKT